MTNQPAILAEATRGGRVESRHAGHAIVTDTDGKTVWSLGRDDAETTIFPRSTVKALLAIPLVETGAAERLGLTDDELALACASHNGEPEHAAIAARMLARVNRNVTCLECGTHWPTDDITARALAASGQNPNALHNNCSGKHSGMICLACDQKQDPTGYILPTHPAQKAATEALAALTGVMHEERNRGTDGCSMPTYAIPLRALAQGFARFGTGTHMHADRATATRRLRHAVARSPFMVAGSRRFDTKIMSHLGPRVFTKMGAEGVMIASLPELGLGFAIKANDGATRAPELALAALLKHFGAPLWTPEEETFLSSLTETPLKNWNGIDVGTLRASPSLLT